MGEASSVAPTKYDSVFWVEVEKIHPNPYQPRKEFDEEALRALSDSIRQYGVLQPLVVTRTEYEKPEGGLATKYELIAGERRLRASKLAGLREVPVVIRSGEENNRMKLELAIIENLQREDLNAIDRAKAFHQLAEEFKMTHGEVGAKVGRSREYVSNSIRLLALPEHMQNAVMNKEMSEGHGRSLLMLSDKPEEMETLFKEVLERKISVRDTEKYARRIAVDRTRKKDLTPEMQDLEKELTEALGTRVHIQRKEKGGQVVIDFFSEEDLTAIRAYIAAREAAEAAAVEFQPEPTADIEVTQEESERAPEAPQEEKKEEDDTIYNIRNFSL